MNTHELHYEFNLSKKITSVISNLNSVNLLNKFTHEYSN